MTSSLVRLCLLFALVPATLSPTAVWAADADYPRERLLMEPSELAKSLDRSDQVILDVRGEEAYAEGHIPGARRVAHDEWKDAFDADAVSEWSRRISELGIDSDSTVVVYDGGELASAARVWWILSFWGLEDPRLLHGGWKAWQSQNLPTTQDPPDAAEPSDFRARPQRERLASKDELLKSLETNGLQIVDTRSEAEYRGSDQRGNARGGAIPGAVHLEWKQLIDSETGRLKSPRQIQELLQQAGVDVDRPVATYCQSGGRASVMAFGLELMGGDRVRNYYSGWSEWGNAEETPVEK